MKNSITKIIDSLKMDRAEFSRITGIPYRTVADWEWEKRKPSSYLVDLLNYRFGKIIYTSTRYVLSRQDAESISSMNIRKIKIFLNEKNLSDAKFLTKHDNIKSYTWFVKKNIIGEYKYSLFNEDMLRILSTDDLEEAIRIVEEQFMLI